MSDTAYQIDGRRLRALAEVDAMPSSLRECVHEFGLPIVRCCVKYGVSDPIHMRELVREIWDGAREGKQTNGVYGTVDWLLIKSGGVSSATLMRVLADHGLTIVPLDPTREMLAASMAEVSGFNIKCTREEKHRLRLRAALVAASKTPFAPSEARRRRMKAASATPSPPDTLGDKT